LVLWVAAKQSLHNALFCCNNRHHKNNYNNSNYNNSN
jgi:hypothetical protein